MVLLTLVTLLTVGLTVATLYLKQNAAVEEEVFYCSITIDDYPVDRTDYAAALELGLTPNETGRVLFNSNCSVCHEVELKIVGPPLMDVHRRRERTWLHAFISNPQAMVESGDEAAVMLFEENDRMIMPAFNFKKAEIDSIIAHIAFESAAR